MRAWNLNQNLRATFSGKSLASLALATLMVIGIGPQEAKAADVLVSCSVSGTFTISDIAGQVVAKNASTCSGTAVIPDGVTKIDLFQNNPNLLRVEIPASVSSIAGFAFANSSNLAAVVFAPNSSLTTIPSYVFSNTKLAAFEVPARVTLIDDASFSGSTRLTSLTFEAGSQLQTIGVSAFASSALTAVTLPASLVTLRNQAFKSNASLASVTFESGSQLTTIGNDVFAGLPQSTIALPSTVSSLGSGPFGSNIRLTVADANPNFMIQNGVLFNKNQTTLIAYAPWLTDVTYVIPASVTTLSSSAFANSQLQSLAIPASVATIGSYTFAGSSRLTEVTFAANSSITRIPSAAFQSSGLIRIRIPASVTLIEGYALNTPLLEEVTFQNNSTLETVSNNVFQAARLRSIEFPASVQSIGDSAFASNTLLTSLTFASGSTLRYLGTNAVRNSPLTTFVLPSPPIRSGYRFLGWSNTSNGTVIANPTTSAQAGGALHAKWLQLSVATFNSNSGSAVAEAGFGAGESISAPTPPTRTGYAFAGWSLTNGGAAVAFPYTPSSTANLTMYALWEAVATVSTGSVADSQVVSIPVGLAAAEIPATSVLPKVSLAFTPTNSSASATVVPIVNPASAEATPFAVTGSTKIVDIQVSGITGPVTVCLDGAATDEIFHFTGGAWVELPQRTYVNGQVCGVTQSFSPFAAADAVSLTFVSPYTGPVLSHVASRVVSTTSESLVTFAGERMAQVNSVNLEGTTVTIVSKSDTQIVVRVPARSAGFVDLVMKSDSGSLTFQDALEYRNPVVRMPLLKSKSLSMSSSMAKTLTIGQQQAVGSFVSSAKPGALLSCAATYVSKSDAAIAKALAAATCASAKKANPALTVRVASPMQAKTVSPRKVLLSLTN